MSEEKVKVKVSKSFRDKYHPIKAFRYQNSVFETTKDRAKELFDKGFVEYAAEDAPIEKKQIKAETEKREIKKP